MYTDGSLLDGYANSVSKQRKRGGNMLGCHQKKKLVENVCLEPCQKSNCTSSEMFFEVNDPDIHALKRD